MMYFHWPYMAGLLLLPLMVIILNMKNNVQHKANSSLWFPSLSKVSSVSKNYSLSIKFFKNVNLMLLLAIWLCLTIALMRPEVIEHTVLSNSKGRDILLAVDLSKSMDGLDFSSSSRELTRLDITKEVVADFIERRAGDKVGMVVFGEKPYLYVPFTYDNQTVSKMLSSLQVGMAGDSTSINDALAVGINAYDKKNNSSKVLILLTDGQDTSSKISLDRVLEYAKKIQVKIYVVGIGNEGVIPIRDDNGRLVRMNTSFDEAHLRKIADDTAGIYAKAGDKQSLVNIYNKIDEMERNTEISRNLVVKKSKHIYPLILATILLIILVINSLKNECSYGY